MTDKKLIQQNFSPAVAVSTMLLVIPVFIYLIMTISGVDELSIISPLVLGFFTICTFGAFAYQIIILRKYVRNFGSSNAIDKIMYIIPFFIIALSILSIISNHYQIEGSLNNIPNTLIKTGNNSSYTTFDPALKKTGNNLVTMLIQLRIFLAIVTWILVFVCSIYMWTLRKRDFVGGIGILATMMFFGSIGGMVLSYTNPLFLSISDLVVIFFISIPILYTLLRARRQGRWFGFRRKRSLKQ